MCVIMEITKIILCIVLFFFGVITGHYTIKHDIKESVNKLKTELNETKEKKHRLERELVGSGYGSYDQWGGFRLRQQSEIIEDMRKRYKEIVENESVQ